MFHVNSLADDSHEISSLIFSEKNNEKVFMNGVCCSRDWCFKDSYLQHELQCAKNRMGELPEEATVIFHF